MVREWRVAAGYHEPLYGKEYNMKSIAIISLFFLTITVVSTTAAKEIPMASAQMISAQKFDASLPLMTVDAWLSSVVPNKVNVTWGSHMTGCGEQTGTSVDADRDMPICAEVEMKGPNEKKAYLLLFVGTRNSGFTPENAQLYWGFYKSGEAFEELRKLGDLRNKNW